MEKVSIHLVTDFEKGTSEENQMVFFTEGVMKKHEDSYTYTYDESQIFQSDLKVTGMLEIGRDYITRSISGDGNYIMHFKKGHVEHIVYDMPQGSFLTEINTKEIHIDLEDGLGTARVLYIISFAESEEMLTEVNITIRRLS